MSGESGEACCGIPAALSRGLQVREQHRGYECTCRVLLGGDATCGQRPSNGPRVVAVVPSQARLPGAVATLVTCRVVLTGHARRQRLRGLLWLWLLLHEVRRRGHAHASGWVGPRRRAHGGRRVAPGTLQAGEQAGGCVGAPGTRHTQPANSSH